jgi:hypothetical protein
LKAEETEANVGPMKPFEFGRFQCEIDVVAQWPPSIPVSSSEEEEQELRYSS